MTPGPAPRPATVARAWPTWLAVVVFGLGALAIGVRLVAALLSGAGA